ncbi:MAG: glycosyltransferase family 9 protein [Candidatus Malihini olakiniferum]
MKQKGLEVVLTCGPGAEDIAVVNEIHDQCQHKPNISPAGKTHFLELAVLIDKTVLYIGVNSAPMHMAVALETPTVCLFGLMDHRKWYPWSDNHIILWAGGYVAILDRNKNTSHVSLLRTSFKPRKYCWLTPRYSAKHSGKIRVSG